MPPKDIAVQWQVAHDADGGRFWNDSWDGWPGQRARILDHIARAGISNPVLITGDWHSTFVNDLKADYKDEDAPVSTFRSFVVKDGVPGAEPA
jgi:phosphodiesterase/alkaline phosphatase D-like protein